MHLNVADIYRICIGVSKDSFEDRRLVAFMGPCNGIRLATMIRVRSCNDAKDGIVICLCVLEPLENDGTNSICSAVATSLIIKRVAVT